MAQKKITDLILISSVADSNNFVVDDGIQTYRCTAAQLYNYLRTKIQTTQTVSAAGTTLTSSSNIVLLNPTSASFTQNLPAVASLPTGFILTLKNIATNGNTVTIDASGSETIDNNLTVTLNSSSTNSDSITILNTGTAWVII